MRPVRPLVMCAACVCALAVLNLDLVRDLVRLSAADPTASHILAVPLLSAWLIYRRRAAIFSVTRTDVPRGAIGAVLGLALLYAGRYVQSLSLSTAALVLLFSTVFLACFGLAATRAARFPLAFLTFAIPLPGAVVLGATHFLKAGSIEAVGALFTLTGTPYYRQGATFTLAGVVIEVADECSGIRSSIALLLTTLLAGHLLFRRLDAKVLLAIVTVPLAILKNAIRIVTLSLLALHVDLDFLRGRLHQEGGIVFFLLTLAMLFGVIVALRRRERPGREPLVSSQPALP